MQLADLAVRFWEELLSRPSGPLAFRFYLQPAIATFLAFRDGYKDAANGRKPYLWTIVHDPSSRKARLTEGVHAVARVMLLGATMEIIYQVWVIGGFRPLEMITIVLLLAFVPYLIVRGPAGRITHWWRRRLGTSQDNRPRHQD
jgi:hypothetical protein